MKKISRIAITAGIALVFVGLICTGFNLRRIRDDIDMIGQKHYTPLQAKFDAAPVHEISTELGDVDVQIASDPDSTQVTVDYYKTPSDRFKVTSSNGIVSITRARARPSQFMCLFRCIGRPNTITIHVPTDSNYAYYLTAEDAPVSFTNSNTLHAQTIHVTSSNSSVRVHKIIAAGALQLRSSNGRIELQDITAGGTVTLNSSNGTNELVRLTAPTIHTTADNGGDTLQTVATHNLNVHASNATVRLDDLQADHTTITSDNGNVEGSLAGAKNQYSIKAWSANGTLQFDGASYPTPYTYGNDTAPKSLSVSASNGRIDLTFDK